MVENKLPSLKITYEGQHVGDLSFDGDRDEFKIFYSADWLRSGFALSPHLPLFEIFSPENTRKFLENLLPEGDALRTLSYSLKIASSNVYALVAAIGRDATGAFTFSSAGEKMKTTFRAISEAELSGRILERATKPISIWDGRPRLSLAGVQEKLAVTIKDGEYGLGEGDLASTHILKFSKNDQHLVLNEYFCMKLAAAVGLSVADVELVRIGERVLQVKRFDREWQDNNHVTRIHVIDGCQTLNVPPGFKYQRIIPVGPEKDNYLGPVNVANLSSFNQQCMIPAKAQLHLLQWILFNLIIGNTENHGKNISYFVTSKGYEIAPAYDLVNVTMYPEFHQELAFKIGDTFVLDEVKAFQLVEMAKEMNLAPRFVASHLKKIVTAIEKHIDEITFDDLSEPENKFMSNLRNNIKKRAEKFLKQASLIAKLV